MEFYGHMFPDASAALGIVQRIGLGKLRHLDTSFLWIQEVNYKRDIDYGKVAGAENPADIGTKHLDVATMEKHLHGMKFRFAVGRSVLAPELNSVCDAVVENSCGRFATKTTGSSRRFQREIRRAH